MRAMPDPVGASPAGELDGLRRKPADFEISLTDDSWTWAGETRPGLPILHFPDGAVCEPVMNYFGYSAEIARVSARSMKVEAYSIRDFLCFLWNRGRRWDQANDLLLREWREEHRRKAVAAAVGKGSGHASDPKARRREKKVPVASPRQIERKIGFVFELYRLLPEAMCLDGDGKPWPAFVGPARCKKSYAIGSKTYSVKTPYGRRTVSRWIGEARLPAGSVRRPAPTAEVVGRVLGRLRSAAVIDPTCRPTRSAIEQSRQLSELNWLEARCGAEAGLRSEEVVNLSISALARSLADEGVGGGLRSPSRRLHELLGMQPTQEIRDRIVSDIEGLAAGGRRDVGVEVTCKGRTRKAPFPIPLVCDLLTIGLWTVRVEQVRNWTELHRGYVAPDEIFLSFKTGQCLRAGALGDTIKAAFRDEGISGSGHRLRTFFGTELAHRLLQVRMALNGYRYDLSVERWVLDHVAEAMGHAQSSTTVKYYVDRALMRIVGAPSTKVLAGMIDVHRALLAKSATLTVDDFSRVLRSVLRDEAHTTPAAPQPPFELQDRATDRGRPPVGEASAEPRRRCPSGRYRAASISKLARHLSTRQQIPFLREGSHI